MKKVFAILLAAAMVLTMGSAVLAQPAPEGYTQMEVFDGTYGFGDAEVTAYTNDDFTAFYLAWEAFDEDQVLEGTVDDGIVSVNYDETGFMTGDAQLIWDDAVAADAWEALGGAAADDAAVAEEPAEEAAEEPAAEEVQADCKDVLEYLWELSPDMSDEDFSKFSVRNFKFVQSIEPMVEAESFNALYKASVHVKQKKEGSKEEFIEAQKNLVLTQSVADGVYFLWDADNMPCLDGEAFTEEELDNGPLDSYGFIPLLVKCLLDDPTQAKGNLIVVSGGGMSNRSNSGEAYPAIEVFNDLGYNVFVLQRRIRPYSDEDIFMDMQRAIRIVRYYAEKEGWGGQDMIADCGWSGGAGTVMGAVNFLYGDLNPTKYCSTYVPDEIDAVNSDTDVTMPIYGGHLEEDCENPNLPAIYTCAGTEDETGAADHIQEMYDAFIARGVPARIDMFEGAGHGFGVGQEGALKGTPECALWPGYADEFMQANLGYSQVPTGAAE